MMDDADPVGIDIIADSSAVIEYAFFPIDVGKYCFLGLAEEVAISAKPKGIIHGACQMKVIFKILIEFFG